MLVILLIIFILTVIRFIIIALPGVELFKDVDLKNYITYNNKCPLYTILIPMFMENIESINKCRECIFKTIYPNFEVLYLCEEVDVLAINHLCSVINTEKERIVIVPRIAPFTKPKACNYGLEIAKGRYVVIYDIEDEPNPLQLNVANYIFQNYSYKCVQFPLEFIYNGTILSLWQCIDYIVWFKKLLPLSFNFNSPIPLGGTSNHFITSELRSSGGWDSYNVTEDAELGLRFNILNKNIAFVSRFSTKETTVNNITVLINQRSRWVKGHILTFLQYAPILAKNCNLYGIFWIFYLLFSNTFIYLSFFYIYFAKYQINYLTQVLMICNIVMFFLLPIWYYIFLKELKFKLWQCVFTYNIYMVFYAIPIFKALIECILLPSYWYKTKR